MLWVLKKNRLNETVLLNTHNTCLKLIGKKEITILRSKILLNWTYGVRNPLLSSYNVVLCLMLLLCFCLKLISVIFHIYHDNQLSYNIVSGHGVLL